MAIPQPNPASWTSSPTFPARARLAAGCQADQAVVQRDPARAEPQGIRPRSRTQPASLERYPDGSSDGAACGDRGRAMGSTRRASSAVRARTSSWACSRMPTSARATRRSTRSTASCSTASPCWPTARRPWSRPSADLRADVDAILALVTERTKPVVSSPIPNNPTGTYLPIDEVRTPARRAAGRHAARARCRLLPSTCAATITKPASSSSRRRHNTVMTRTFSKIYGLAALRLGWAYCPPEVADVLNRIRGPFNLSAPALAAGVAAIDRQRARGAAPPTTRNGAVVSAEHREARAQGDAERGELRARPLSEGDKAQRACGRRVPEVARASSCAASAPTACPNALRMTIGTGTDNKRCMAALGRFHAGHRVMSPAPPEKQGMPEADVRPDRPSRHRPHRLLDQPCGAARRARRRRSSAARARPRRVDTALKTRPRRQGLCRARLKPCRAPTSSSSARRSARARRIAADDRPASRAGRHPDRRRLGQGRGRARRRSAHARGRALHCRASDRGHRAIGPRGGFRRAVRRPLVHPDARRGRPTTAPSPSSKPSGRRSAPTSRS